MTVAVGLDVARLDRTAIQSWLSSLDEWLLPDNAYSVHHTWPALYRSDGRGSFFTIFDGDRLVSHCATLEVTVCGENGRFDATLLGSVATDPDYRGRGLAGRVIDAAVAASSEVADHVLLWAERPDLYEQHGFVPAASERCVVLARRPVSPSSGVIRPAEVSDHEAIHRLHAAKPWRVDRSFGDTSGLLTTPGLTTLVLCRDGEVSAYACCGKGADLRGHWHEVGGEDADIAELLQHALHHCGQIQAVLLLPPYRTSLPIALGSSAIGQFWVPGPMSHSHRDPLPACWIDGLDSV